MARKKRQPKQDQTSIAGMTPREHVEPEPIEATGVVDGLADAPRAVAEPVSAPKERIVVTLDTSGGLDLESMRQATRERLTEALRKSQSDLLPKLPDAPIKRWPDFAVRAIYSVMGAAETSVASKQVPMEIASEIFMFSDAEIEVLMEPTQAVLSKHAGRFDKYQEEIALTLVLVQIHFAKLNTLKEMMRNIEKEKARQAKPETRTPGPRPVTDQIEEVQ